MNFRKINHPLVQLCLWRLNEFLRRPEALFWTYGFPFIMLVALGFAFRNTSPQPLDIEVIGPRATEVAQQLQHASSDLNVKSFDDGNWSKRLQSGRVNAVVQTASDPAVYELWSEDSRSESRTARWIISSVLSSPAQPLVTLSPKHLDAPGSQYIDFLVPGMMAMNLMGGGLWGIGFSIVDMRVRKLLKRFLATPVSRVQFMTSLMIVRIVFATFELVALILFSYFVFDVQCKGSLFDLAIVLLIGGVTFVGIGLLIASRVQTIEAISGLMNLIMVPMWILGGVFFSNERFPEVIQPVLKSLPFVALVDSLRAIMLDGVSIMQLGQPIAVMIAWAVGCFVLALKIFRWR